MSSITIDCDNWDFHKIRRLIIYRDKSTCRDCGRKEYLEVHHINGRGDNSPESLITLCRFCHDKRHGTKNIQRIPFIKKLMLEKGITILGDVAPRLGISQSAISQMLNKGNWKIIDRALKLVNIVNTEAGTNYTLEEMFAIIDRD